MRGGAGGVPGAFISPGEAGGDGDADSDGESGEEGEGSEGSGDTQCIGDPRGEDMNSSRSDDGDGVSEMSSEIASKEQ